MRVQTGQHAGDRLLHQLAILDRLDVVGLDGAEHLGELADLLQRNRAVRIAEGIGGQAIADREPGDRSNAHQTPTAQTSTAHAASRPGVCQTR